MKGETSSATDRPGETAKLTGRGTSHGLAVGRALCLHGRKRQFYRREIAHNEIAAELERQARACSVAHAQLEALVAASPTHNAAEIFDAHLLILEGSSFANGISNYISEHRVNAEWAVKIVADGLVSRQMAVADSRIRSRFHDIEDVSERVLNALGDTVEESVQLGTDTIIVASQIRPSTLMEYRSSPPIAIVTEHGGWTSHAFILAREMGIPAIAGVKKLLRHVATGDTLHIDADRGEILVNPAGEAERPNSSAKILSPANVKTAETRPNINAIVRLNLDDASRYPELKGTDAAGIGLVRSEYLFTGIKGWPDEAAQFDAYKAVADSVGADTAKIRTFDFGLDQVSFDGTEPETNPALGMRAIRLSLAREKHFRSQMRSIIRANADRNLSIILPMVAGVSEVKTAKAVMDEEISILRANGSDLDLPPLGAMIELPAAVLVIDQLVRHLAFVCVGTNDLVQYTLGVDRDNENVAEWYQTLHPSVLRSIKSVIDAAAEAGIPASICGEMGGSPFYLPLLLGLGAVEFSIKSSSFSRIVDGLRDIDRDAARSIAETAMTFETAQEIETFLESEYRDRWPQLLSR